MHLRLRRRHCYRAILAALLGAALLGPPPAHAGQTVTVDTTSDVFDAEIEEWEDLMDDPGGDNVISLREAIFACNLHSNGGSPDIIHFDIPLDDAGHVYYRDDGQPGVLSLIATTTLDDASIPDFDPDYPGTPFSWYRNQPASPLSDITDPLIIDGSSQPGFAGHPIIELSGAGAGTDISALTVRAGGSTLRGLVINAFDDSGVRLLDLGGNTVVGNYLGPDASGVQGGVGNRDQGLMIYNSPNNQIGGLAAADRNVISGNHLRGLWIDDYSDGAPIASGSTRIEGNYIGINATGDDRLPYDGGASPSYQQIGIAVWDGADNVIGSAGIGNVLSGNSWYGIYLWGPNARDNRIQGNIVGLDESGTSPVPNAFDDPSRAGIHLSTAPANWIGGVAAGQGNLIAGNAAPGIGINGDGATGNCILSNSLFDNAGLGIDLGGDGVSANDNGDFDIGPNGLLNFPVITLARKSGSNIQVAFELDVPAGNYRVEFYTNSSGGDPTGYGEGKNRISWSPIAHPGDGVRNFGTSVPAAVGDILTATVTEDLGGNQYGATSEFSRAVQASGAFVVNSTGDASDDNPGDGLCDTGDLNSEGDPECTLRAALEEANALGLPHEISFNMPDTETGYRALGPGLSYWRHQPGSPLPDLLADGTVLDATTQTTYALGRGYDLNDAGPEVELDGSLAGDADGLRVTSSHNELRGFAINGFDQYERAAIDFVSADSNTVAGNYLGTDTYGAAAMGNYYGIYLESSAHNFIGSPAAEDRNLISGNSEDAVYLTDPETVGNIVLGNYLGTNAAGTATLANGDRGVQIEAGASDNRIGGGDPGAGNLISGNLGDGVIIADWNGSGTSGNIVQGNRIGTDITGSADLGNGEHGVHLGPVSGSLIGGTNPGEGNLIAYSTWHGIQTEADALEGNAFLGNAIHSNSLRGIDLANDGVDSNDPGDGDGGPNGKQNYPVLLTAATDESSTITITGSLNSTAATTFRLEFFANDAADPSGYGEGQIYLGSTDASTDPTGNASFGLDLPGAVPVGAAISATATDPADNSSEFAQTLVAMLSNTHSISGIVFEDVDFAGSAANWDGGASDVVLPNVDVELYDAADSYLASTLTDANGAFSFISLPDGDYKVRARSSTLGDADTPPAQGFNATVPGTWPYPLPDLTWAHLGDLIGGQNPAADDTVTPDNGGPGDTYVPVNLAGAHVGGVNFGFCYELIVNESDDGAADAVRSQQGCLRQFIKNANAIAGANHSWFQIPGL